MALYRYRPRGNRTPVLHPVFGHLEWDGVYDHPDCAGHPDFQLIKDSAPTEDRPAADESTAEASAETAKPPAHSKADAGKTGRSN